MSVYLHRHINPLETPLKDPDALKKNLHPYTHGGGFGIATEILADPFAATLLHELEPRRFKVCNEILENHDRKLNAASAKKIVLAMENSPVVAALAQIKFGPIPLEWDLWLDSKNPQSPEQAIVEHGSMRATLFSKFPFMRCFSKASSSVSDWIDIYKKALERLKKNHEIEKISIEKIPICLDIKSSWSTAHDINLFIQNIKKEFQINVRYVGSFSYQHLDKIENPDIEIPRKFFFVMQSGI